MAIGAVDGSVRGMPAAPPIPVGVHPVLIMAAHIDAATGAYSYELALPRGTRGLVMGYSSTQNNWNTMGSPDVAEVTTGWTSRYYGSLTNDRSGLYDLLSDELLGLRRIRFTYTNGYVNNHIAMHALVSNQAIQFVSGGSSSAQIAVDEGVKTSAVWMAGGAPSESDMVVHGTEGGRRWGMVEDKVAYAMDSATNNVFYAAYRDGAIAP